MDEQEDADMEQRLINEGVSFHETVVVFPSDDALQSTKRGRRTARSSMI
jgi:hypothetical protein